MSCGGGQVCYVAPPCPTAFTSCPTTFTPLYPTTFTSCPTSECGLSTALPLFTTTYYYLQLLLTTTTNYYDYLLLYLQRVRTVDCLNSTTGETINNHFLCGKRPAVAAECNTHDCDDGSSLPPPLLTHHRHTHTHTPPPPPPPLPTHHHTHTTTTLHHCTPPLHTTTHTRTPNTLTTPNPFHSIPSSIFIPPSRCSIPLEDRAVCGGFYEDQMSKVASVLSQKSLCKSYGCCFAKASSK